MWHPRGICTRSASPSQILNPHTGADYTCTLPKKHGSRRSRTSIRKLRLSQKPGLPRLRPSTSTFKLQAGLGSLILTVSAHDLPYLPSSLDRSCAHHVALYALRGSHGRLSCSRDVLHWSPSSPSRCAGCRGRIRALQLPTFPSQPLRRDTSDNSPLFHSSRSHIG